MTAPGCGPLPAEPRGANRGCCDASMPDPPTVVPKLALTIEEACQALTISRPTLYELIASGRIRTVMVGRRRLVPVAELERLLAADT